MLSTQIAGIPLENCIFNASGPRTASVEALLKIGQSTAGAVLAKSATLVEQSGNPLPRFVNKLNLGDYCEGSINSEGLPNQGIDYYISEDTISKVHATGKPYIVSISGLCLDDNLAMLDKIAQVPKGQIAAVELNLACPNIPNKPMAAYDFEQMDNILKRITTHPSFPKLPPFGLKMAPYFDMPHFDRAASIVANYEGVKFIVCVNSIGNGLVVDWENECEGMAAKQGLGGVGGGFVKHTALANVRLFSRLFSSKYERPDIDIIGVGGVHSGIDAFELILCGAKAIQIGTCHWTEGPGCFQRISAELEAIMRKKGYKSIEDFRGKLKAFMPPNRSAKKPAGGEDVGRGTPLTRDTALVSDINNKVIPKEVEKENIWRQANSLLNPFNMILVIIIASLLAKDYYM